MRKAADDHGRVFKSETMKNSDKELLITSKPKTSVFRGRTQNLEQHRSKLMAKLKASSLQDVEEIREVEGHWDLFKEVVDKKELEDNNLEIQQRFLNHQPGAKRKSTKPEKLEV